MIFVRVCEDLNDVPLEVPVDVSFKMPLSSLQSLFPGACGLKYLPQRARFFRGVRCIGDDLIMPEEGWASHVFICVYPKENMREVVYRDMQEMRDKRRTTDLVVLGLNYSTTERELLQFFEERFGPLCMAVIKIDPETKLSRGFGFIRFMYYRDQVRLLTLKKILFNNRWVNVKAPCTEDGLYELPSKIFIGRLQPEMTTAVLRTHFRIFGEILEIDIPRPFRSFGFVTFLNPESALAAIKENNLIRGKSVYVSLANIGFKEELKVKEKMKKKFTGKRSVSELSAKNGELSQDKVNDKDVRPTSGNVPSQPDRAQHNNGPPQQSAPSNKGPSQQPAPPNKGPSQLPAPLNKGPSQQPAPPNKGPPQQPAPPNKGPAQQPAPPNNGPPQQPVTLNGGQSRQPAVPNSGPPQQPAIQNIGPPQQPIIPNSGPSQQPVMPTGTLPQHTATSISGPPQQSIAPNPPQQQLNINQALQQFVPRPPVIPGGDLNVVTTLLAAAINDQALRTLLGGVPQIRPPAVQQPMVQQNIPQRPMIMQQNNPQQINVQPNSNQQPPFNQLTNQPINHQQGPRNTVPQSFNQQPGPVTQNVPSQHSQMPNTSMHQPSHHQIPAMTHSGSKEPSSTSTSMPISEPPASITVKNIAKLQTGTSSHPSLEEESSNDKSRKKSKFAVLPEAIKQESLYYEAIKKEPVSPEPADVIASSPEHGDTEHERQSSTRSSKRPRLELEVIDVDKIRDDDTFRRSESHSWGSGSDQGMPNYSRDEFFKVSGSQQAEPGGFSSRHDDPSGLSKRKPGLLPHPVGVARFNSRHDDPFGLNDPEPGSFPSGSGPNQSGPGPYPGGTGPYQGGPGSYQGGSGPYQGGPGLYQGGPAPYQAGPGPYQAGPGPYPVGPGPYQGGPGPYPVGPGQFQGGPGPYQVGPGQFQGGPGQYQGGPGSYQGGPGSYQGGPGSFQSMPMYQSGPGGVQQQGSSFQNPQQQWQGSGFGPMSGVQPGSFGPAR